MTATGKITFFVCGSEQPIARKNIKLMACQPRNTKPSTRIYPRMNTSDQHSNNRHSGNHICNTISAAIRAELDHQQAIIRACETGRRPWLFTKYPMDIFYTHKNCVLPVYKWLDQSIDRAVVRSSKTLELDDQAKKYVRTLAKRAARNYLDSGQHGRTGWTKYTPYDYAEYAAEQASKIPGRFEKYYTRAHAFHIMFTVCDDENNKNTCE